MTILESCLGILFDTFRREFSKSKYGHSHHTNKVPDTGVSLVGAVRWTRMWRNFVVDCNNVCYNNFGGSII